MVIYVKVTDKRASVTGAPVIVCGNSGYTVEFTFDSEWSALGAKTARFVYVQEGEVKYQDVVFTENTAAVPVLANTKEVRVGVFAGDLKTSTPAVVPCELSIRCGTGAPADPTPSQYDQIMALLAAGGGGSGGGGTGGGGIVVESDPTVPAWAKAAEKPTYTPSEIGALPASTQIPAKTSDLQNDSGFITAAVASLLNYYLKTETYAKGETYSQTEVDALISGLDKRLSAIADSDDTTLDQLSEIVAYIKANKSLIDSITTSKVSVADIVDNLTTGAANRPLSAAQGVALKKLIDALDTGKLDAAELPEAINIALAQAKESGEFDGAPGKTAYAYAQEGGYTRTEAEFAQKLAEEYVPLNNITLGIHTDGLVYIFVNGSPMGSGVEMQTSAPISGYIDSENNLILKENTPGALPDGEYTAGFVMEDGSIITIGQLVKDTNVYYSVTNNLTNCVNSNSATQAVQGESYAATITANDGYELKSVSVTMGGEAVSVSGGSINIAEVTGNIVITAVAEEIKAAEPITVDIALTNGKRIGSDGTLRDQAGYSITDDIDLTSIPKPCTIHLTGSKWAYANTTDTGYVQYYTKKADGTKLLSGYTDDSDDFDQFTIDTNNGDITDVTVTIKSDEVAFIRLCGNHTYNNGSFDNAKATLTYTPKS